MENAIGMPPDELRPVPSTIEHLESLLSSCGFDTLDEYPDIDELHERLSDLQTQSQSLSLDAKRLLKIELRERLTAAHLVNADALVERAIKTPSEDAGLPAVTAEKRSAANRNDAAAESKLLFRTAAQLRDETPTSVPWLAEPWVAEGSITEVVGKPKAAGKSTFMLRLIRACISGVDFLGKRTRKSKSVILTEERATTFREGLRRADLLDSEDLTILTWRDTMGIPFERIIAEATEECIRRGASMLIVDTVSQFAQLPGDAENNAGHVLEMYKPLQKAAAQGLAVVTGRHERKSGGDVATSGRGSSAFTGAADIVVALRRPDGNTRSSMREIHALSRFDETPDFLAIELTEHGYVAVGSSAAVAQVEGEKSILSVAPSNEGDALQTEDFVRETGVKRTTAQAVIEKLVEIGQLTRVGEGKKGSPYRYYAPSIHSAATSIPIPAERIHSDEEISQ